MIHSNGRRLSLNACSTQGLNAPLGDISPKILTTCFGVRLSARIWDFSSRFGIVEGTPLRPHTGPRKPRIHFGPLRELASMTWKYVEAGQATRMFKHGPVPLQGRGDGGAAMQW